MYVVRKDEKINNKELYHTKETSADTMQYINL
jgi:hypothetical protein